MKLKPRHPLPMVLFGLPFFIAGVVVLILGFLSLYNTIQAQSWEKVPVTILKLEIKTHEGDDGNTYSIDTEYQYNYQNQPYHGHRFSFSMGNDSVSDHTTLIQVVKSRDPAYGFVNPNQPSESVLVKEISPMVGLMVPFGMVFLLVGVGVMSGSMTGTTVSPNEVQSYLPDGKIVADNSRSKLALFLLPILSCFFMVFINAIFLLKWTGPANTFYITLGVIGLGFWGGWYLSHRSYTEADIRIDTPPGNLQPFAFSLQLKEEPATVPITNTFPTNPSTAKLTIFVSEGSGEDKKEHELLSAGFNTTAVTPFNHHFVIAPTSIQVADTNRLNQVPEALKTLSERFKNMPQYQEYLAMLEMAKHISQALQGGPEAHSATQYVREFSNATQNNHPLSSKLTLTIGRKKIHFILPHDIWSG